MVATSSFVSRPGLVGCTDLLSSGSSASVVRTGGRLVKELKRREVELFEGKMRREEDLARREEGLREAVGRLEEQRKARVVLFEESSMLEMEIRVFKTLLDQANHSGCL